MSGLGKVRSAQADVADVQAALSAVQSGLGVVEAAGEVAGEARRGFRRLVKLGLVLLVIAAIAAVWAKYLRGDDEGDAPTLA